MADPVGPDVHQNAVSTGYAAGRRSASFGRSPSSAQRSPRKDRARVNGCPGLGMNIHVTKVVLHCYVRLC